MIPKCRCKRKMNLFYVVMLICCHFVQAQNILKNGDFESGLTNWDITGGIGTDSAYHGKCAFVITNEKPQWSSARQVIALPDSVTHIDISGWMRTGNVLQGSQDWETARISVEYVDTNEKVVGEYPPLVGKANGTSGWTFYRKRLPVNKGAAAVKVELALGNAVGTAFFDEIELTLLSIDPHKQLEQFKKGGNQLANPGFEEGAIEWAFWGGEISSVKKTGKTGIMVHNDKRKWSGIDQIVPIPKQARTITVAGWIKTDTVIQGEKPWEMARISVEFLDKNRKLRGGYPPVTGQVAGTNDWSRFTKTYDKDAGSEYVKVICALGNATGTAFFDDILCEFKDQKGNRVAAVKSGPVDQGEWYPLAAGNAASGSHYVDWSSLLDPPAGKHGMLTDKNGQLQFSDGTPARFFGTNLVASNCFTAKDTVDSLVSRLAKMGCNLLRLHHMDAPWSTPNIFGNTEGTRQLDPIVLERLDYLIHTCKQKGIYIFLDILVHRDFTPADGVKHKPPDRGGKQVAFFSERIIELQKEYAGQLLNHKNKYTGKAYKDEPAIAASEFINESTIFVHFGGDILTEPYRKELVDLWKQSEFKEKKLAVFGLNWDTQPLQLIAKEEGDVKGSISFLSSLEKSYFSDMEKHFRSIGVTYPLAGSNMPLPLLATLKNNAQLPLILSNTYWDHPKIWQIGGDWSRRYYAPFDNLSQLKNLSSNVIHEKTYYKVNEKPFIITEWNHCYPNEYVLEGVPFITAYACLQGWNGLLQFDFDCNALGGKRISLFSVSTSPEDVAMWVAAAPMFLRQDIAEAPGLIVEAVNEEMTGSVPNVSQFLEKLPHLPFITRVAKTFTGKGIGDPSQYAGYYNKEKKIVTSETGELILDTEKGIVRINSLRLQGAIGFISGENIDLPYFSFTVKNTHAGILAVSADGRSLKKSKHVYIVAVGPTKMSDQLYRPSRSALLEPGRLPVLAQVIKGKLTIHTHASQKKVSLIPLAVDGSTGKPVKLTRGKKGLGYDLSTGRTHVYEMKIK